MKADGEIIIEREWNTLGTVEAERYRWEGGPIARLGLMHELVNLGNGRVKVGPYRLRCLDQEFMNFMSVPYVREDYPFWWALVWWHKATRPLDLVYRRTILTLAVWNLAEYHQSRIPTWKDIKLLKKWMGDR